MVDHSNFTKVLECIKRTASSYGLDEDVVAIIMDGEYPGVAVSHYFGKFTKLVGNELVFYSASGKESGRQLIADELSFVHKSFESLSANVTGCREGETLKGFRSGAKGAVMKLKEGIIPACKEDLIFMMADRLQWKRFLAKLATIPFFADLKEQDRALWLVAHQKSGEFDFADVKVTLQVLEAGESAFSQKLDEETLQTVLSRDWNSLDLRNQFPRKPGTREGHRNVLTFFPRYWAIAQTAQKVKFKGLMTDLKTVTRGEGYGLVIENFGPTKLSLGVLVPNDNRPGKVSYKTNLANVSRNFTPAVFKSLLQKLIRASPLTVDVAGEIHPSRDVLEDCFKLLYFHPGSFVPDIQRFVSGRESAIKRLMISIIEDSWASDEVILELALLACFAQRYPEEDLDEGTLKRLLKYAVQALETPNYFDHAYFKLKNKPVLEPWILSADRSPLENASALLDDIRSFGSDLAMTRALASYPSFSKSNPKRPKVWPISKAFDQHTSPEIAYLFSLETLERYYDGNSTHPYANFFHELFLQVSGVNARKPTTGLSAHIPKDDPQLREEADAAQSLMLKLVTGQLSTSSTKPIYETRGSLSVEWISGLVGVIEVRGAIASLRPEDPYQIVALPKPTRGSKESRLSDEAQEKAIEDARKVLMGGVSLVAASSPIPSLKGQKMFLAKLPTEEYPVYLFGKSREDIQKGYYQTFEEISKYKVMSTVDVNTVDFPDSEPVRRKLLTYFSFSSEIEVTRLSKDGGGTELFASLLDAEVLKWLLLFSQDHPDVIERLPKSLTRYRILKPPVVWELKARLVELVRSSSRPSSRPPLAPSSREGWKPLSDTSGRVPKSYQVESMEEMFAKKTKGNFLWLSVGLGKTMIVMMYLAKSISEGMLPKYVVYTLPKSAIESVIREIDSFGAQVNVCIPIQSWKKNQHASRAQVRDGLVPFAINVIEHDHLRKMESVLVENAPETFLIVDEVHKTFGETKRTSVALELARLSYDFIALTGTVVVNTNLYQLIWWLQQILPYEVTERNFWSAINGMVSKKSTTGINVERHLISGNFNPSEQTEYEKLVPPTLGGRNPKPLAADFQRAFELSYQAATREMIRLTLDFVRQKVPSMVVVRNYDHQAQVASELKKKGVNVLLIGPTSVNVTDDLVESGKASPFQVAIVPQSFSTGYTLTYAKVQITSVYPSNQANREQIEGRINRVTQRSKTIHYYVVTSGILDHVLEKHNAAANLSSVMTQIQKEVGSGF